MPGARLRPTTTVLTAELTRAGGADFASYRTYYTPIMLYQGHRYSHVCGQGTSTGTLASTWADYRRTEHGFMAIGLHYSDLIESLTNTGL